MIDYMEIVKKSGDKYLEYIKFQGIESVVHYDDQLVDLDIVMFISKKTGFIHIFYVNVINEVYRNTPITAKGDYEKRAFSASVRALGEIYKTISAIVGASKRTRAKFPTSYTWDDIKKVKK